MENEEKEFNLKEPIKQSPGIELNEDYSQYIEKNDEKNENKLEDSKLRLSLWRNGPLSFSRMGGVGIVECCDCGYKEEVHCSVQGVINLDGVNKRGFWRSVQCPNCFAFEVETHYSGKQDEGLKCSHCGTVIREKGGTIYQARDKHLVCPKCHSVQLRYMMSYLT